MTWREFTDGLQTFLMVSAVAVGALIAALLLFAFFLPVLLVTIIVGGVVVIFALIFRRQINLNVVATDANKSLEDKPRADREGSDQ